MWYTWWMGCTQSRSLTELGCLPVARVVTDRQPRFVVKLQRDPVLTKLRAAGLDEQQQTTIILILTHFTVYVPEIPRGSTRYQGISLAEIWTLKMCPWANCTLKENQSSLVQLASLFRKYHTFVKEKGILYEGNPHLLRINKGTTDGAELISYRVVFSLHRRGLVGEKRFESKRPIFGTVLPCPALSYQTHGYDH